GYLLLFPFYVADIAGMQIAQVVHSIVAVLFVALILGHIYIGTLGMEGAFEAMWTGEVDLNWAKEHHDLWLEDELAQHRCPAITASSHGHPQQNECNRREVTSEFLNRFERIGTRTKTTRLPKPGQSASS